MTRPTIPGWRMKVRTAAKKWAEVRAADASGDPDRMTTAVSKFEPIAEEALRHWSEVSK